MSRPEIWIEWLRVSRRPKLVEKLNWTFTWVDTYSSKYALSHEIDLVEIENDFAKNYETLKEIVVSGTITKARLQSNRETAGECNSDLQ